MTGEGVVMFLLYFVGLNYEKGVSVSVTDWKIAGLAFLFKLTGGDVTKNVMVRQALKGYRRGNRRCDSRHPVTFSMLHQLMLQVSRVCNSSFEPSLFKAAFALAFYGAFRLGELVSPFRTALGGIQVSDVHCTSSLVALFLRRSKTDRWGKGKYVHVYGVPGEVVCPVAAVREFLVVCPLGGGSFLVHQDGPSLSVFQIRSVFRRCLVSAGYNPSAYSSHSFRIGAATEAGRWALDKSVIKRIGHWESDRFKLYVHPHLE